MLNSFFIMEMYDSWDINTQRKIFTSYLTKLIGNDAYGNKVYTPNYTIGGSVPNQFYNWYLPVWYLTGSTIITGYTKFSFYNATNGKVMPFYNYDNEASITAEKQYFNSFINVTGKTWNIYTPPTHAGVVIARELWSSTAYSDKLDNTVENYNNQAQDYPSGNAFNSTDGKYITLS